MSKFVETKTEKSEENQEKMPEDCIENVKEETIAEPIIDRKLPFNNQSSKTTILPKKYLF